MLAFPSGSELIFHATDPTSVSYRSDPSALLPIPALTSGFRKSGGRAEVGSADKAATVFASGLARLRPLARTFALPSVSVQYRLIRRLA